MNGIRVFLPLTFYMEAKGVIDEPFTNLSFNTRDINQLEMGINQSTQLTQTQKKQGN